MLLVIINYMIACGLAARNVSFDNPPSSYTDWLYIPKINDDQFLHLQLKESSCELNYVKRDFSVLSFCGIGDLPEIQKWLDGYMTFVALHPTNSIGTDGKEREEFSKRKNYFKSKSGDLGNAAIHKITNRSTEDEARRKLYGSLQIFCQFTDKVIDLIRDINLSGIFTRTDTSSRRELEELLENKMLFHKDDYPFTEEFLAGNWQQLLESHFLSEEPDHELRALRDPKIFITIMKITHLNLMQINMGKFNRYIQAVSSYKNLLLQRINFLLMEQKFSNGFFRKVVDAIDFVTFPRVAWVSLEFLSEVVAPEFQRYAGIDDEQMHWILSFTGSMNNFLTTMAEDGIIPRFPFNYPDELYLPLSIPKFLAEYKKSLENNEGDFIDSLNQEQGVFEILGGIFSSQAIGNLKQLLWEKNERPSNFPFEASKKGFLSYCGKVNANLLDCLHDYFI
jgi:hypothetical protein